MLIRLNSLFPLNFFLCLSSLYADVKSFKFTEFSYKETKKNEIIFREFETACQQTSTCALKRGIENIKCIRECVSPSCYSVIYKDDELEEGEIDVRLNSFKGCFIQRSKNRGQ